MQRPLTKIVRTGISPSIIGGFRKRSAWVLRNVMATVIIMGGATYITESLLILIGTIKSNRKAEVLSGTTNTGLHT
jgi:hypothetical protein